MKIQDALNVLNLTAEGITLKDVKKAFRNSCKKFHPDVNPSGHEMMQLINNAMDALSEACFPLNGSQQDDAVDYGSAINAKLNEIFGLDGLIIEVMGSWIWITGETKKHRHALSKAKFYYAKKKKAWYFHPPQQNTRRFRGNTSLHDIRTNYGSSVVSNNPRNYKSISA